MIDVSDSVYQIHVTLVRLLNLVLAVLLEQKEASSCVWGAALRLLLFLCCEDGEVNKDLYAYDDWIVMKSNFCFS